MVCVLRADQSEAPAIRAAFEAVQRGPRGRELVGDEEHRLDLGLARIPAEGGIPVGRRPAAAAHEAALPGSAQRRDAAMVRAAGSQCAIGDQLVIRSLKNEVDDALELRAVAEPPALL